MFPEQYYYPVYIYSLLLISAVQYYQLQGMPRGVLLHVREERGSTWVFGLLFIVMVGLRPVAAIFGDTESYAIIYEGYQSGSIVYNPGSSEWLFYKLMSTCAQQMDVQGFYLIVEVFYIIPMLWACKRLFPYNMGIAVLFCVAGFSFFSYGVNGIRNGMACSFLLLAFSFMHGKKWDKVLATLCCLVALSVHRSTALPVTCMLIAYFYRNTKMLMAFWVFSIFISLVAGGALDTLFSSLGFDSRLSHYINNRTHDSAFSHTGFRWDFLLYSMMPIVLGWYVVIRKGIASRRYLFLLHTYILSNAFWVMLIRSSFSNRFAYLSWFMYPLVIAYPLLTLPIWKEQGRMVGMILMAHVGFTYFMWIVRG